MTTTATTYPRRSLTFRKPALTLILLFALHFFAQAGSWGDYTLYSTKNSTKAYLIDLTGAIYHTWTFSSSKPTGYSTYLLPDRVLLRTVARSGNSFTGGPICGEVQKVAWDGTVIWDYVYSTTEYCTHHDICPMPNGNVLLIAYETKAPAQVSAAGCSQSITMWPDKIVEIQPVGASGGTVVWEWHAWDHLSQNQFSAKANYVTSIVQHPELLNINYLTQKDWMHVNGIDYNAQLDQITFSSHYLNEFYVIDHSTTSSEAATHTGGNAGKGGDLIYRWGNPSAYQATGTTNFNVVHDAHWVPADCPKANYLVGFNNTGGNGGKTCIDLVSPPYNSYNYTITAGSAFTPSAYTWRHTYSGSPTTNEGNSQQLPNGNMLVNISFSGYMYEIDSNQNVVWSKTVSGVNTSAFRYSACYVNGNPVIDAIASPGQICQGAATQLNVTIASGTVTAYSWTSSPAGFTSTLQNPTVSPSSTTTYFVTATNGSCSASDSVVVTVSSPLTVLATASPASICPSQSSVLNATVSGSALCTYSWVSNPAGFTSSLQNPTVYPTTSTVYTVTATNGNCSATGTTTVTVTNPFSVGATAFPTSVCQGQSSQLSSAATGSATCTYSWASVPAGFTSTLQNPLVAPTVTTTYYVTADNGSCTATNTVLVTVNAPFALQASANPGSVCYGEASQLSATPGGSSASYTYTWSSNPAGFSSGLQNPSVSPLSTTIYTVMVSDGSCSVSATATVNVTGPINVQATAMPQVVCAGSVTQLNAAVSGGSSYSYAWTSVPAGFTSSLQNPVANPLVPTNYYVSVQNSPCLANGQVAIIANPLPSKPSITRFGDTLYSSAASGNQWYLNSNSLNGETGSSLVAHQNGSYSVLTTDANGCTSPMSETIPIILTSVNAFDYSLAIYPNPSSGILHIDGITTDLEDLSITVFDFRGSRVKYQEFSDFIDLSDLTNGVYFLIISRKGNTILSRKIALQK